MHRLVLPISLLILPLSSALADDEAVSRWALIATDEVVESGLLDLLTVHLSRDESLQLVEREQLQMAMRELQLSALLKGDQVSQRLQLGKTLKANALMVLSVEHQNDRALLRVVVCDADLGLRLWQGNFAYNGKSDLEELAQQCATIVDEVRQRFANGIRHIIAVPPFFSEDFEQRFDYLQSRYSDLLSNSLLAHAGVGVVEIEEARAVLRELEDTLSGGLERPIATVVKATYRVTPPDNDNQRYVKLKIDLAHGDHQQEQIDKALRLGTVGPWLVRDLVKHLLSSSKDRTPALSPKTQMQILSRHAQRFAELGNWEQSTSLREAALVLNPNDARQRGLLIGEYQYGIRRHVEENWHRARFTKPLPPEPRERALRLAAHDYCVGLEHLAYLIRNRLIGQVDAIGIFGKHAWYFPPPPRYAFGGAQALDPLKFDALQPACVAQRAFLRDVYPLVDKLPAGQLLPKHLSEPYYGGQNVVTNHVVSDVGFNSYSAESLASLRDLVTRILPEDAQTTSNLLLVCGFTNVPKQGDANFAVWSELLTDLSGSDHEVARLYGRYALAVDEKRRRKSSALLERLVDEVKRLGRTGEPIFGATNTRLMRPRDQPQLSPTAPPLRGNFGPLGRMQLEPIPLVVEGERSAKRTPQIIGMLRCGDCDAYWSKDRFFIMHEPNVLREVKLTDASAEHTLFWEVTWDGEFIWLHAHGQGIIVIRPDGTRLASFQGKTPSYWKGHKLVGLAPGRALMAGSFGATNRAWCGLLEVDEDGKSSVNVFFKAMHTRQGRTPKQASADVKTAFQPVELIQVTHKDGRPYVQVDRKGLLPLQIDLKTWHVSVRKEAGVGAPSTRTDLGFSGKRFVRNGRPVLALSGFTSLPNSDRLVYHDGWLYRPGYVWMREHAESGKLERLQAHELNRTHWHLRAGASAHYGLITFDPHHRNPPISRVTILDDAGPAEQ